MSEVQVPCAFGTAQVAAFRTQRQAAARGLQGGLAVEGIGGLHGKNSMAEKTATRPTGAHETRDFDLCSSLFVRFKAELVEAFEVWRTTTS